MNCALTNMDIEVRSGVGQEVSPRGPGPRRRARAQIATIVALGACVVCALWLIIYVAIRSEHDSAIEHARREANNLSAAFQAEVEGKLDSVERTVSFLANRLRTDGQLNLYTWAREHRSLAETAMQSVGVISPEGKLLSTSREPRTPIVDVSDRDYFRAQLDRSFHGTYVGTLVVGR